MAVALKVKLYWFYSSKLLPNKQKTCQSICHSKKCYLFQTKKNSRLYWIPTKMHWKISPEIKTKLYTISPHENPSGTKFWIKQSQFYTVLN